MNVLLGNQINTLPPKEARDYADALLVMLEKTRGNRRLARELHATLTHLATNT